MENDSQTQVDNELSDGQQEIDVHSDSRVSDNPDVAEKVRAEPKLRSTRITANFAYLLRIDAASCLRTHSKFLVLGTDRGHIYVLDHQGNKIRDVEFRPHASPVNDISIDDSGEYIASCSNDGIVSVNGIYSTELDMKSVYHSSVQAVSLCPQYGRGGRYRSYIVGGSDQVLLYEKRYFRLKSTVLYSGNGAVRVIKRKGNLIAWANDMGIKLYDFICRQEIGTVKWEDSKPSVDPYVCKLCWKDDVTLLIGYGRTVKICSIRDVLSRGDNGPSKFVETTWQFHLDFVVVGLSCILNNVAVLTCPIVGLDISCSLSELPQLHFLSTGKEEGSLEESDMEFFIRQHRPDKFGDYHLERLGDEDILFVVGPKDIICVQLCDMDDHLEFLMDVSKYKEALLEARQNRKLLNRLTVGEVGLRYLEFLVNVKKEYAEAATSCEDLIGSNVASWEYVVTLFTHQRQLKSISLYLPYEHIQLSSSVYDLVLSGLFTDCYEEFLRLLEVWRDLYNAEAIERLLETELDPEDSCYWEAKARLDVNAERYHKAAIMYLKLGHEYVFDLIEDHNLVDCVRKHLAQLMDINAKRAAAVLLMMLEAIPISDVVKRLNDRPELKHTYLEALFVKDPLLCEDFHFELVELYAEYNRPNLLYFLRSSSSYSLEEALAICRQRQLYEEEAYILERMGNHQQALCLIVEKLGRVEEAIAFAAKHDDEELWEDLMTWSLNKPAFITGLLSNIGTHVNPISLVLRIPRGLLIPGLRWSLVKMIQDYNLQLSLFEGFRKILVSESVSLMRRLLRTSCRGTRVHGKTVCEGCHESILWEDNRKARSVIVYCHGTVYHEFCLPVQLAV